MKLLYARKASGGSNREEGSLRDCHAGQYNFVSLREGLACQLKMGDMQTGHRNMQMGQKDVKI